MVKFIGHKSEYWKAHKPSRIGIHILTIHEWDRFICLIERFNKSINYNTIKKYFIKKAKRKLNKKIAIFKETKEDIDAIKEQAFFMTYEYDQEKKRQENIDNKARQIITNISLIFTFIAFSSAILLNKDNYNQEIGTLSIISIIIALFIALISIILAVLCLEVRKYSRPQKEIVFEQKNYIEKNFLKTKILRFYNSANRNIEVNNKKCKFIKLANWLFIVSVIFVGVFTTLNLYTIKLRDKNEEKNKIQQLKFNDTINVKVLNIIESNCFNKESEK